MISKTLCISDLKKIRNNSNRSYRWIWDIIYSKYCDESYFKDWMLVPKVYQLFYINTENYKVYQLKIRKKDYLLIKKQGNSS